MTNRANQNWPASEVIDATEVIQFTPELVIRNTKQLAPGLGLRHLECIRSHTGELVAKRWFRDFPKNAAIVVVF